ncbi:hypothetical protein LTR95_010180 [Oleoguttula sp. CCFEE 5521]
MFCTSLRRRHAFADAVQELIDTPEYDLSTHDLAIPIKSSDNTSTRQLRVLLLSPVDTATKTLPATLVRIERFTALTGGVDLAIVFLLSHSPNTSLSTEATMTGLEGYAALQAALFAQPHPPILPVATLNALPILLLRHAAALVRPFCKPKLTATIHFELLRFCTAASADQGQAMDQHTVFRITDLFPSVPALARTLTGVHGIAAVSKSSSPGPTMPVSAAEGPESARLRELRDVVGEVEFANLVDFWAEEWVMD